MRQLESSKRTSSTQEAPTRHTRPEKIRRMKPELAGLAHLRHAGMDIIPCSVSLSGVSSLLEARVCGANLQNVFKRAVPQRFVHRKSLLRARRIPAHDVRPSDCYAWGA